MVVRKSDLFIEKRQDEQVAKFVNLTEILMKLIMTATSLFNSYSRWYL